MSSFSVQVKETEATIDQTDDLEADRMFKQLSLDQSCKFNNNLFTFNDGIDSALGCDGTSTKGGFTPGTVTEVAGQAGSGKTQLCMHLCAAVQLPAVIGGLGGRAIYLDADGSFCAERMNQIAESTRKTALKQMVSIGTKHSLKGRMADRNMMDGIFYRRIDSLDHLLDALTESNDICNLIKRYSDIRLIILDSIAFHFRYSLLSSFENTSSNIGKLHRIAQSLNLIANKFNIVVIVTNQMTTRPKLSGSKNDSRGDDNFYMTPALGDSWAHACSSRIILDFCNRKRIEESDKDEKFMQLLKSIAIHNEPYHKYRTLTLVKSPRHKTPTQFALFRITPDGIRDAL